MTSLTALYIDPATGTPRPVSVQATADGQLLIFGSGGGGGGTVSGTVEITNDIGKAIPVTVAGVATATLQTAGNSTLEDILDKLPSLDAGKVPVSTGLQTGSGAVSATTQRVTLATDGPGISALTAIDSDIGAPSSAAAAADGTGDYAIIPALKRGLLNWATLLARLPALVAGRLPVDGSGVTQPVSPDITRASGPVDANTQRVTLATDGPVVLGLGVTTDAAAAADGTGNYAIIPALKRSLLNWATLLARIPALAGGRVPVQTDERPSASAAAIAPSDTVNLAGTTRGIYVGAAGTVVALIGGQAITFAGVPAGTILPVQASRVNATGTTASLLVALF